MLRDIAGLVGRRAPRAGLPWRALLPLAYVAEAVANVTGREPLTTLDGGALVSRCGIFGSLGHEPSGFSNGGGFSNGVDVSIALLGAQRTTSFVDCRGL
jgi:hypothetical protein